MDFGNTNCNNCLDNTIAQSILVYTLLLLSCKHNTQFFWRPPSTLTGVKLPNNRVIFPHFVVAQFSHILCITWGKRFQQVRKIFAWPLCFSKCSWSGSFSKIGFQLCYFIWRISAYSTISSCSTFSERTKFYNINVGFSFDVKYDIHYGFHGDRTLIIIIEH